MRAYRYVNDENIVLYSKKNNDKLYGEEVFIPVQVKGKDVNVFSNKSSYTVKTIHICKEFAKKKRYLEEEKHN